MLFTFLFIFFNSIQSRCTNCKHLLRENNFFWNSPYVTRKCQLFPKDGGKDFFYSCTARLNPHMCGPQATLFSPCNFNQQVNEEVNEEVNKQVTQQVTDQVIQQITEKVIQQVTQQVIQQVSEKVTEQINEKVAEQVTEQINEQITEHLE